jgi:hypothetical protein
VTNSRAKGKRGELELAHILTDAGFPAERAQQYKGGQHSDDIHCPSLKVHGFHIEGKRVERLNIDKAMDQAIKDSGGLAAVHLVAHRRNKGMWLATMPLDELLQLLHDAGINGTLGDNDDG